ncbi:MAG TPA: 50S ribosomal protein L13, partial [Opitutaceae bacterium]
MKTYLAKKETVQPKWYLVDAEGQVLGRLAVKLANIIRGRNKAGYTPHVDTGDYVVVLNAEKVVLTGRKEEKNKYMFFSGFVGGERYRSIPQVRAKTPEFII